MNKKNLYLLGLLTSIGFPLIGISLLYFIEGVNWLSVLELENLVHPYTFLGLIWGVLFAFISSFFFSKNNEETDINQQRKLLLSLNLNFSDKVFISFCAGFGEEILFRSSLQYWLGIWITSVVFIAIHGYLNPKKPKLALYGILLIPFIASLGYALKPLSLWFCIAAHFSYDLILLLNLKEEEEQVFFLKKKKSSI